MVPEVEFNSKTHDNLRSFQANYIFLSDVRFLILPDLFLSLTNGLWPLVNFLLLLRGIEKDKDDVRKRFMKISNKYSKIILKLELDFIRFLVLFILKSIMFIEHRVCMMVIPKN